MNPFYGLHALRFAAFGAPCAVMLTIAQCQPTPGPVPPPAPVDASDAAPVPPPVRDASVPTADANPIRIDDASVSTVCELACAALTAAGCTEGSHPKCVESMSYLDTTRFMRRPDGEPISCAGVATVRTAQDAVAQGVGCTLTKAAATDAGRHGDAR